MRKLFLLGLSTMLFYVTGYSTTKVSSNPIELTVVHINDHHSHLEEEKMTLKLNGKDVTVNVGGMPSPIAQYLITLDWKAPIYAVIIVILGIIMYYPFFKMYEKSVLAEEEKVVEVDKELEELDLDF